MYFANVQDKRQLKNLYRNFLTGMELTLLYIFLLKQIKVIYGTMKLDESNNISSIET